MADISAIKLPNGTTYTLKDSGALQLTGGQVTGPVSFGDSVTIDEATIGDLVTNGNASFTNNIQANTINGVSVGSSPKFTDTTYSSLAAASGGTAVSLVTTGEKYTWNSKTSNTGTITSVKTTAGAHTAINVTSGAVSFNVPTTAAHVGIKFGYTTSGNNRAVLQDSSGNLYVTQKDNDTNTTYTLSGALSSHKFTSTLTAGGSGSGTSTSELTLAAGSNVTLTDDTTNKKITIAATDTTYSTMSASELTTGTATTARTMSAANTKAGLLDLFYPVGCFYHTSDGDFDPNVAWGGRWVKVEDRFLLGAGTTFAAGTEDGSKDAVIVSHHHTTNTYHRHTVSGSKYGSNYCAAGNRSGVGANSDANTTLYVTYAGSQTAASTTVGEDGTNKNMPPYLAVYIWHRTE